MLDGSTDDQFSGSQPGHAGGSDLLPLRGPVALVTPGWPPEAMSNGIVSYTARIRRVLRALGMRVFVVGPVVCTCSEASGDDVIDVSSDYEKKNMLKRAVQKVCCRLGVDRVGRRRLTKRLAMALDQLVRDHGLQLAQMEESFGWADPVSQTLRVPLIVRAAGPWFLVGPSQGVPADRTFESRVRAEGLGLRSAAGVFAPSRHVLDAISDYYGFVPKVSAVIPSPIAPCTPDKRWRLKGSAKGRILFVGRFDRCKGGDLVIRAFGRVVSEHHDAKLVFVGPDTGMIRAAGGANMHLSEFLDGMGESIVDRGRIEVLGRQTPEQIARLRLDCQVSVVCSRFENFPNTILEAMSQGSPIVASDVGGIPEMIQHERNGLLCRPDDSEDLADKILTLLRDPDFAAGLAAQAAIDAEDRYHPDKIARKTLAFYRRVIGSCTREGGPRETACFGSCGEAGSQS